MIVNKYANGNGGGGGTGSTITVDAALSSSSTNPVENRVITNAISEFVTNEYVENRFDSAEAYTDSQVNNLDEQLSAAITAATENMATQDYVDTAINEELQDYATEAYVDNAITAATEDLASTQYVDDAIAGIVIPEPPEDYATTGDVANAVEGLASESYVDGAISTATEHMVTTDDLQDYATEQYVDDAVNGLSQGIGMLGMVNNVSESNGTVTVMKTTMQDGHLVTGSTSFDIVTSGDIQNFVTSGDVATAITAATENLATEQYVDDAIAAIPTGSTVTVDSALSSSSTNPVQNKVITKKFENYATKTQLDSGWTDSTDIVISENNSLYKATIETSFGVVGEVTFKNTNISNVFGYHYEIPQSEQGQGVPWWIKLSTLKFSTSINFDFEGNNEEGYLEAYQDYFYYGIAQRSQSVPGYGNNTIIWGNAPLSSDSCDIFIDRKRNVIWCQELNVPYNVSHARYVTEDDLDNYVSKEEYVNGVTGGTDIELASGSTVWSVFETTDGQVSHFFNTNQPGIYMIKQTIGDGTYGISMLTGNDVIYGFMKENPEDSQIDGELDAEYPYVVFDDGDESMTDTINWAGSSGGLYGAYYLILNTNNQTIKLSAKPVIPHVYPSLDDFVTSGDVQDIVDEAMTAYTITVDDEISTASTNPVENRVIANALGNFVQSTSVRTIVSCTQAEYDAMQSHDPNTFYIITGVNS